MNENKPNLNHVAIIMDGNGRWAKKRNLPRSFGHKEGKKSVIKIIEHCYRLGIIHHLYHPNPRPSGESSNPSAWS
ncbi:MAG: undecaprenyl diphosphate synthase family protein [Clostridia bacterium]|nr:undecaprenyl diphosphate synthase family protein [Clostridia bacterium]